MSRITEKQNIRVEVEPSTGYAGFWERDWLKSQQAKEKEALSVAESILREINRHVDGVASAVVLWDSKPICEHCGAAWTEESDTYNGGCCSTDEANASTDTIAVDSQAGGF